MITTGIRPDLCLRNASRQLTPSSSGIFRPVAAGHLSRLCFEHSGQTGHANCIGFRRDFTDIVTLVIGLHGYLTDLGKRIAEARKAKGMTQVQLAEALSISQQTVAHYEGGRLRITASMIPAIAKAIDVSVMDLMDEPGSAPTGGGAVIPPRNNRYQK